MKRVTVLKYRKSNTKSYNGKKPVISGNLLVNNHESLEFWVIAKSPGYVGDREELVVMRSCSRGIIHAGFTEVV